MGRIRLRFWHAKPQHYDRDCHRDTVCCLRYRIEMSGGASTSFPLSHVDSTAGVHIKTGPGRGGEIRNVYSNIDGEPVRHS